MPDYDEPIEELSVPTITLKRLKAAGVRTILEAKARIADPHGLAIPSHQLDELRHAVADWENGGCFQRSNTD